MLPVLSQPELRYGDGAAGEILRMFAGRNDDPLG